MLLSDTQILAAMELGDIVIEPFDRECLGSNSYDVHLSKHMALYYVEPNQERPGRRFLDAREDNLIERFEIRDDGFTLKPGAVYLASTVEYTETHKHVAYIDGKSSIGRLGISIHLTAGRGDVGFCNHWTLEVTVVHAVRVYAGMPIGQLTYHETGPVSQSYRDKASAKYNGRDPMPQASRMYRNFARCETCGKVIRNGLRFCSGLSPCWKARGLSSDSSEVEFLRWNNKEKP